MTQNFGKQGEELVVHYLKNQNFIILAQNYKQFFGEIDIIARKDNVISFIEVKTRNDSKVSLFELISFSKKQKIIKTARQYITAHCIQENIIFRFDVALVHYQTKKAPEISYISNAF